MNDFLDRIKAIIKSDPSVLQGDFQRFLYVQLTSYNLGKNQIPFTNIGDLFDNWITNSENVNNLQTFVSDNHPYFCQFINADANDIAKDAIKLYIPMDESHIYEGVNRLFKFIADSGIKHNSKVGKKIRNDVVVVRVSNIEEAEKVINFVKNDPYIQSSLLNTNPFTINVDGVGIAKDGYRSYNSELCNNLARFINILISKNRLDDLNMSTFHEYLEEVKNYGDEDLQTICSLQSAVTTGRKLNFDDFKNIINNKDLDVDLGYKEEILKRAIIETVNKYGINHTIGALAKYISNGDAGSFTRNNGARVNLQMYVSKYDVNRIINKSNTRSNNYLEEYINNVMMTNKGIEFDYIVRAYFDTMIRYNKEQANTAVYKYVVEGDYHYFTNAKGGRDNLKKINYNNIETILKNGLGITSYCTREDLVNDFINHMSNSYRRSL